MLMLSRAHDDPERHPVFVPKVLQRSEELQIYLVPPKALIRAPEARWSKLCLLMTLDS